MTMIDIKPVAKAVRERMDQLSLSPVMLAKKMGTHPSTIYRIIKEETKRVERETLKALAGALDLHFNIKGSEVTFSLSSGERQKEEDRQRNLAILGVSDMLKKMDMKQLTALDEIARIIAEMDGEDLIDLQKVCGMISGETNKKKFIRKLKAMSELVMSYDPEEIHEEWKKT